jgi:hypothetical protein
MRGWAGLSGRTPLEGGGVLRFYFLVSWQRRSADLSDRFTGCHRSREGDVEAAAAARHRDLEARIRRIMDMLRDACRFAAEEQDVGAGEFEAGVGQFGAGRKQHKPSSFRPPPILEAREVEVACEGRHFEIIHPGASQRPVGKVEAGRLDDVDCEPEASGEPQDRAGIAGDIRLVEGDAQTDAQFEEFLEPDELEWSSSSLFGNMIFSEKSATVRDHAVKRDLPATLCQDARKTSHLAVAFFRKAVYRAPVFNSNRRRRTWNS